MWCKNKRFTGVTARQKPSTVSTVFHFTRWWMNTHANYRWCCCLSSFMKGNLLSHTVNTEAALKSKNAPTTYFFKYVFSSQEDEVKMRKMWYLKALDFFVWDIPRMLSLTRIWGIWRPNQYSNAEVLNHWAEDQYWAIGESVRGRKEKNTNAFESVGFYYEKKKLTGYSVRHISRWLSTVEIWSRGAFLFLSQWSYTERFCQQGSKNESKINVSSLKILKHPMMSQQ